MRPISLLILAAFGLSACVEALGTPQAVGASGGGSGGGGAVAPRPALFAPDITSQCLGRAARSLGVDRSAIVVSSSLSVPEGDIVTMEVPGSGTVRCNADVDGVITGLYRLNGGSIAPPDVVAAALGGAG